MEPVTIEAVVARQSELEKMIAALTTQSATRALCIPEATISLAPGEHYAGLILNEDGTPSHHVVLLPGTEESINWGNAKKWAASIEGELPTRREQSLLYANLKSEFAGAWYWSSEQHAADSYGAWCQLFGDGSQYYHLKNYELRARAVRRLAI